VIGTGTGTGQQGAWAARSVAGKRWEMKLEGVPGVGDNVGTDQMESDQVAHLRVQIKPSRTHPISEVHQSMAG